MPDHAARETALFRPHARQVLADDWAVLTKHSFDLRRRDGSWQRLTRETYDRGNAACALLHDPARDCVLLVRQFRLPAFVQGEAGPLIEVPAGRLEGAAAADRMRAELEEEAGVTVTAMTHLFDLYSSPGTVTELQSYFIGTYAPGDLTGPGGGLQDEGEDIERLELPLDEALGMIETGAIRDAKTVLLLQHLALRLARSAAGTP
ncbi:NUDIX domain-containing protein [Pseudoroseicyclus aestuarii]|uniref:GDP-mannose pyrophosphatase n=1 Tax=Pseudoroseicyclus aestuarii TaxID=1795041 RepID=A0A318T0B4_9RHOB|nr:NUDIX domain-containing protein [Pseudoroseicyclus aestuarii]PYE86059.1 nudix-type nucleoside diphosphatase (YffH/AdpP family) [Pseudoroseicyclus aestuarii]